MAGMPHPLMTRHSNGSQQSVYSANSQQGLLQHQQLQSPSPLGHSASYSSRPSFGSQGGSMNLAAPTAPALQVVPESRSRRGLDREDSLDSEKELTSLKDLNEYSVTSSSQAEVDPSTRKQMDVAARAVGVLYFFVFIVGCVATPMLLSKTSSVTYVTPEGSPSKLGRDRLWDKFPQIAMASESQVMMAVRSKNGVDSVLTAAVWDFSTNISQRVKIDYRTAPLDPVVIGYYTGEKDLGLDPKDDILYHGYISKDLTTTLLVFMARQNIPPELNISAWQGRENVISFLEEYVHNPPAGCEVIIAGNPIADHDAAYDNSNELLFRAEMCTIPVAMAVLMYLVRHVRLLVLPPIVLLMTFGTACILVTPVTWFTWPYSTDIPPAMISVTIALSLDYSLFLLTRFNENRLDGMSVHANVMNMLENTAHTIFVSGLLIAIAFAGAITIPEDNLREAGVCLSVTAIACLIVNSTLTPALLLLGGNWFNGGGAPVNGIKAGRSTSTGSEQLGLLNYRGDDNSTRSARLAALGSSGENSSLRRGSSVSGLNHTANVDASLKAQGYTGWLRLMRIIERCPFLVVLLVVLAFSPLLFQLPALHVSGDAYATMPASLPSIASLREIEKTGFPMGRFEPFTLVVAWKWPQDVREWATLKMPNGLKSAMLCSYAFEAMLDLADSVWQLDSVAALLGPVWMIDTRVDWEYAHTLNSAVLQAHLVKLRKLYGAILETHITEQEAVLQIHTPFLSRGKGATDWVWKIRETMQAWEERNPKFTVTFAGGATAAADIKKAVCDSLPIYVGSVTVGVMIMVLFLFRALLLPLRLAFALLFTLACTFSVAVVIYQTPLLHSWIPHLQYYNGLTYECVPIATCIAIALGLDYDIFLISRVVEYRLEGLSDRDSIVYGVAKTGGIISGAGIIMSLAFSGLMFSSKLMHEQFAVLLIASVLLDTFVVRTILVPALMLSAGKWNWWPREMPGVSYDDESADESANESVGSATDVGTDQDLTP
eukprot:TRINITY_DN27814_c0_g1_i1.p1 TRINITY_DN27814_c0_g1~~TRINITY_DN27814_c0_g1_i1.p1  ORF type:complete len:999 (-),score=104.44 TRINITY_DN27814_c0_g1_i1:154-3150(-)